MPVLPDGDRIDLWAEIMRKLSAEHGGTGAATKADLRAAVNAIDTLLHNQSGAINQALPEVVRQELDAKAKAQLFAWTVLKRLVVHYG